MIGIIDYDAGTSKCGKALQYLGQETVVSRNPQVLLKADKVILPGVGALVMLWKSQKIRTCSGNT